MLNNTFLSFRWKVVFFLSLAKNWRNFWVQIMAKLNTKHKKCFPIYKYRTSCSYLLSQEFKVPVAFILLGLQLYLLVWTMSKDEKPRASFKDGATPPYPDCHASLPCPETPPAHIHFPLWEHPVLWVSALCDHITSETHLWGLASQGAAQPEAWVWNWLLAGS